MVHEELDCINDVTSSTTRGVFFREVGVAKQVERTLVIDDDGNAVMLVKETTGVVVENEDGRAVAVQTAVHGVVLGNVLSQQGEPTRPAIEAARPTPTVITQPSHKDKECCTCCCCIKWTLITILCLPFLPLILLCYCCCCDDDD